jgi:RNA polymerase sigma-70 factor (ECF subfamily)
MAFMLMLERLSPVERAVLLLHDVFDFEYGEIARVVDRSEANCRQLLSRAKKHLGKAETRFDADPAQAERLLERFNTAANTGDVDGMLALLAEDITLWADGGGKARGAALVPVHGAEKVARFLAAVVAKWRSSGEVRVDAVSAGLGLSLHSSGHLRGVITLEAHGDCVTQVFIVVNPDKLTRLRDGR